MTGGSETNSDGAPMRPPGPADRVWAHPSEIGLATRGHVARRRSSMIATGVVLGGLGLLLSGVMLGTGRDDPRDVVQAASTSRIASTLASVVALADGERAVSSGVVLDEDGHLLVPSAAVQDADEVWARCEDGERVRVTEVGSDRTAGITVLRMPAPSGTPAVVASGAMPRTDHQVLLAHATEARTVTRSATLDTGAQLAGYPTPRDHVTVTEQAADDLDDPTTDRFVFDRSGRLLGMVEPAGAEGSPSAERTTVLRPAGELVEAARELVGPTG